MHKCFPKHLHKGTAKNAIISETEEDDEESEYGKIHSRQGCYKASRTVAQAYHPPQGTTQAVDKMPNKHKLHQ